MRRYQTLHLDTNEGKGEHRFCWNYNTLWSHTILHNL
jgi:hypothetical protein